MKTISVKDRSMIFNTDLMETLEFDNLIRRRLQLWSLRIIEKKVGALMQEKIFLKEMIRII
ncbi:MAG: hypothetical protein CM1200mP5_5800 [Candidatus Pelagibacterales bacterium]|nr:MAG: hypothetical protein CM1200mP5_5800 [Pelagibacterales bacterium]